MFLPVFNLYATLHVSYDTVSHQQRSVFLLLYSFRRAKLLRTHRQTQKYKKKIAEVICVNLFVSFEINQYYSSAMGKCLEDFAY